jgi:hypothetical protein
MPLPSNIPKRGLSVEEAAEYCGVSEPTLRRHGPAPAKIGERVIYDRVALADLRALIQNTCSGGPRGLPAPTRSSIEAAFLSGS